MTPEASKAVALDAGVVIEMVLATRQGVAAARQVRNADLVSPGLVDAEVFHRLATMEKHGLMSADRLSEALLDLRTLPMTRIPVDLLLDDARAFVGAVSGYDALYLAVAARYSATLGTTDKRLARTADRQFGIPVMVFPGSGRPSAA